LQLFWVIIRYILREGIETRNQVSFINNAGFASSGFKNQGKITTNFFQKNSLTEVNVQFFYQIKAIQIFACFFN